MQSYLKKKKKKKKFKTHKKTFIGKTDRTYIRCQLQHLRYFGADAEVGSNQFLPALQSEAGENWLEETFLSPQFCQFCQLFFLFLLEKKNCYSSRLLL